MTEKTMPIVLASILFFGGAGCSSIRKKTSRDSVYTGLFGNRKEALTEAFARIEESKTTVEELRDIGFDLRAKNVSSFEGPRAFEKLFEGQQVHIDLRDPLGLLTEVKQYTLYLIPYKDIVTVSDRFYLNKQKTTVKGWDVTLYIITRDSVVIVARRRELYNDTESYKKAFLRGVLDALGELGDIFRAGMRNF